MIKSSKKCLECDRPAFSKGLCQIHQPKKSIKQSRATTKEKNTGKQEKTGGEGGKHVAESGESASVFLGFLFSCLIPYARAATRFFSAGCVRPDGR